MSQKLQPRFDFAASRESRVRELVERTAPPEFLADEDACTFLVTLLSSGTPEAAHAVHDGNDVESGAFFKDERSLAVLIGQFFGDASDGDGEATSLSAEARRLAKLVAELALEERAEAKPKIGAATSSTSVRPSRMDNEHPRNFQKVETGQNSLEVNPSNLPLAEAKERDKKKQARQERKAALRKKRSNKKNKVHAINGKTSSDGEIMSSDDTDRDQKKTQTAEEVEAQSALELEELDDYGAAWSQCQEEGRSWGGRGHGGRGVRGNTSSTSNVHLSNVTLQFAGNELLQNSTIQITKGRRYGLIGRNGVGKSTLLRRLAAKAVPGLPKNLRVLLVRQQVEGGMESSLDALLSAHEELSALLAEQAHLEQEMDEAVSDPNGYVSADRVAAVAERLGDLSAELDAIDADQAEEKARNILKGLQFTREMIEGPTQNLSGGWKMRLALARALFVPTDLLLLDEPTNHLDFHALLWLTDYLSRSEHTLIVVSHDRAFLDICTDIINFEHKKLKYHVGNFSAFEQQQQERAARQAQILDASERQRDKAVAFVAKQQASANKKRQDPKKLRQAKTVKEKKLDRIGNYREDGKRYKNRSLKKLSEDYLRTAEKVVIEEDEPPVKFKLPNPSWAPGMLGSSALIQVDNVSFGYSAQSQPLLRGLTLDLSPGSKVAVVGRNGAGKSTLLKLITGDLVPNRESRNSGEVWRHPCLRIGHVTQHHVEALDAHAAMTVVEYANHFLRRGTGCSAITDSTGNIRSYLGGFGLGGKHANRLVGSLSGGERMRLCFATVLSEQPHLLVLDEPTNHMDLETLDALAAALKIFEGAVIIVSHNQGFLCGFCKELWVVDEGAVEVRHSDSETFGDTFSKYRNETLAGAKERSTIRQKKASMAKRATAQRSGAVQSSGFVP